jgi:predicted MFS family arabinose efflux permease
MTAVMGAFSVASVFGVPAGLWLAQRAGWRMPFFSVAGLGAVVAASALFVMPSMRHHLTQVHQEPMSALLRDPAALLALAAVATVMMAAFAIIPSMSPFLQFNRGYPRDTLDRLYMVGGAVSFLAMWAIGRAIDRFGAPPVALGGTALFVTILWFGFVQQAPWPCLLIFIGFMLGMSFRNMPMTTLSTRVPMAHQRAGFMSAQSAVQHMSAAISSFVSSSLLKERPDRSLQGMDRVAFVAILLSLALPPLLVVIQKRVKIREARPV